MKAKKLIKKLGYGVATHYNEYTKKYEIYKIGQYMPGSGLDGQVCSSKNIVKAYKKYLKSKA